MSKPVWQQLGLSDSEYQLIREKMGREPNFLELSLFSAMWSEHCGYKNSKPLFSYFPTSGPRVLQGPGENAGIVDIGDGLAITMKVESHNHPSALAPFQGAATGAGGIIRDILAVGSEPVALLNSLHFGPIEANRRNRYLLREVVHGIGEYGNCVGIPTLGGEVKFGDVYSGNPLVNAMCVGMLKIEDIKKAVATGPGNSVMIVGNWTGRDGVGGAAFASKELHDESDEERSAVQVGDPFMEKLLIEACLEAFKQDYVIGVQDLGAAGLISSTSETADKADTGIVIDVAKVPQRENDMEPWQIMLSESQERMLLIVEKGSEGLVNEIFHRWDLHAVVIGQVTDDGILRVVVDGNEVGNVPVAALNEPPMYRREGIVPLHMREAESVDSDALAPITDHNNTLLQMLASPNIASKRWVYQQYDQQVKTNTVTPPGEDSGVFRIKGTDKAIAVTMDSNGHYGHIDAYNAGKIIVAEACRNLVSKGARPIAVTDGLNFGNPEKLDVYWQLEASIRGISEACKSFAVPVISGNASLYNEAPEGAIYPTPIIGMVGLIEAVERVPRGYFTAPGDHVYVLGKTRAELGASEFLRHIHGQRQGPLPEIDLALETRHQEALLHLLANELLSAVHDIGDGGIAVALAEMTMAGNIGASLRIDEPMRADHFLYSESQGRYLLCCRPENSAAITAYCRTENLHLQLVGQTAAERLTITQNGEEIVDLDVASLRAAYEDYLPAIMKLDE